MAAQDARTLAGEDTVCDYCLSDHELFHQLCVAAGPITFFGDACPDCLTEAERE